MTNEQSVLYALLRNRFYAFIVKLFEILEGGAVFASNWHIKTMAYYLELSVTDTNNRLIIAIGPRYLKSFCASVALPIWILGRDPAAHIICVSYSDDLAMHFSRLRRTALDNWFIKLLFPKLRISAKKNTEKEIVTTEGGEIYTTSVGGTLTGRGADYIIIDDPIKSGDAMSDAERQKVNDWYRNTAFSRLNNKNTGRIIIVAQRVHYDDLIGHILETEENDWVVLVIPAIASEMEIYATGINERYVRKAGEPIHADRESREILEAIKSAVGSIVFETQYQQNPVPPGGNIFKSEWFKRHRYFSGSEFDRIIQSWDTANVTDEGASYSVCTVWGIREHRYYLLHVLRDRLGFPALKRAVVQLARVWGASDILIEKAASGYALLESLYNETSLPLIPIVPNNDKSTRAEQASGVFASGRVFIPEEAPWLALYEHEMFGFPNVKHSDQVDSTTQFLLWIQKTWPPELHINAYVLKSGSNTRDRYAERTGISVFRDLF